MGATQRESRQAFPGGTAFWRVAAYARLSREDGATGESDSIVGQRELIDDWARRRGNIAVVAHYADDGFSGSTFDRPGFAQMMHDAGRGVFDTIVVKDLSRFGRSYLDCGRLIERELPSMGVRLYSISDGFDSMERWDYNTALLVPMKNLMNEMQVVSTSEKVRTSLRAKRERGECVANFAPYGYAKDPADRHRLVVDEEAARVVRRIFELRLAGSSASAIARHLNRCGVESPAARKARCGTGYRTCFCQDDVPRWHANTVMRILRDETYTGTLVQGKTQRPSWRMHVGLPIASDEWQRFAGAHEAIVESEVFAEVGKLIGASGASSRCIAFAIPIMGHLICGKCGSPVKRVKVSSRGKSYSYYVCVAHKRNARSCDSRYMKAESVESKLAELGIGDMQHDASKDVRIMMEGGRLSVVVV